MHLGLRYDRLKYIILGDDVVIGDRRVALCYKQILQDLGVD